MADISDISHPTGLKPKEKFFDEIGEACINMDGVIELARRIDSPQAKAIYRAFRKRHAEFRTSMRGQPAEKIREEAMLAGLKDLGFNINFTRISGTL